MILFSMGGQSHRFTVAGYQRPKWMLPIGGKSMLEWAVLGLSDYFDSEQFVFAFRDQAGSKSVIAEALEAAGLESAALVDIETYTRGQAETVAVALDKLAAPNDESLLILNIDTLLPKFALPAPSELGDGWLQCVEAPGDHWSFVLPEAANSRRVAAVAEKSRISDYCSTGAYFFREVSSFREAFRRDAIELSDTELFVAPLYRHLIAEANEVTFDLISSEDVFFCGDPLEYRNCLSRVDQIEQAYGV